MRDEIILIKKYLAEFLQQLRCYPLSVPLWQSLFLFPTWRRYLLANKNALQDGLPWITFTSLSFLSRILNTSMVVFEYGSGGSTIYLSKRVERLISIEHDDNWYQNLSSQIMSMGLSNIDLRLVQPTEIADNSPQDPSNPVDFISSVNKYSNKSFKQYVDVICEYPDNYFDLILIDGRSRPSCFYRALKKAKTGGFIIWDNTDRTRYFYSMLQAEQGFRMSDFPGPAPYISYFSRTTIWQKRS